MAGEKNDPKSTLDLGGVAQARREEDRSIMPASVRKQGYLAIASGPRKFAEFTLVGDVTTIGRGPQVDLVIEEPSASRQHAAVLRTPDGYCLKDLDSTNGTYLHGVLQGSERELADGDCFRIGATELVFHAPRDES